MDFTKTTSAEIAQALLTCDGCGKAAKESALVELVARLLNEQASSPEFGPFFMDLDRSAARGLLGLPPNPKFRDTAGT